MSKRTKEILDQTHEWPTVFVFKFIVPAAGVESFKTRLNAAGKCTERPSENGRYTAFTLEIEVASSEAVLEIYARVADIPGILSL